MRLCLHLFINYVVCKEKEFSCAGLVYSEAISKPFELMCFGVCASKCSLHWSRGMSFPSFFSCPFLFFSMCIKEKVLILSVIFLKTGERMNSRKGGGCCRFRYGLIPFHVC